MHYHNGNEHIHLKNIISIYTVSSLFGQIDNLLFKSLKKTNDLKQVDRIHINVIQYLARIKNNYMLIALNIHHSLLTRNSLQASKVLHQQKKT